MQVINIKFHVGIFDMKFIIAFWTYIFIGELFGLLWVSSVAFTYTMFQVGLLASMF